MKATVFFLCTILFVAAGSHAQGPKCSDERSHDFDFWIGTWNVTAGGQFAGTNAIEPILNGCVLQENWSGVSGSAGSSFNFYNPITKKWHQFWVWRNGTTLELEGGYADGQMMLEGESKTKEGKTVGNRITWYDNSDGTVRQHWQTSTDGGSTWKDAFDGLYSKPKAPEVGSTDADGRDGGDS